MPHDTNLVLLDDTTVDSTTTTTAISVEGGTFAQVHLICRTNAVGTSPTLTLAVQASFDGGSKWVALDTFPQLSKAADKGNAGTRIAKVIYIPRSEENPDARGVNTQVKLRVSSTIGGSDSPSFDVKMWVTHLSGMPYGQNAGFTSGKAGIYGPLDRIRNFAA